MTSGSAMRPHWVKMAYPGEVPVVVCEVVQCPGGLWHAYHKTQPSQRRGHGATESPGGVDVGTVAYLQGLSVAIRSFTIHYTNGERYCFAFGRVEKQRPEFVPLPDGSSRHRIFLPKTAAFDFTYPVPAIPHEHEVRITPDGTVLQTFLA